MPDVVRLRLIHRTSRAGTRPSATIFSTNDASIRIDRPIFTKGTFLNKIHFRQVDSLLAVISAASDILNSFT